MKQDVNKILNYWYKIEYFTPCWPIDFKRDINLKKNRNKLPWTDKPKSEDTIHYYDLYFGKIKSMDLIDWMLSSIDLPKEDRIEPDNSNTCIFAIKLSENGLYVENSFSISSFVWAVCEIVSSNSMGAELSAEKVKLFENKVNEKLLKHQEENKKAFDKSMLEDIFSRICNNIKLNTDIIDDCLWCRDIKQKRENGNFSEINPATELFQSFYLNDIKKVMSQPDDKIKKYVLGNENLNCKCIDSDVSEMKKWVETNKYPLGVWPSTYNPSLMQQIGINICTSGEKKIFSVNGPPGTGKTTLLKEIIVSNIIERAKLLVKYNKPDDAFCPEEFKNPCDQFNRRYYKMDNKLKKYGILVASNNNAAVENISMELPKKISKDRTGRFSKDVGDTDDIYFSDVASELIGQPAWGLISAKLGKKSNLNTLKNRLWWKKDNITLKNYYKINEVTDKVTKKEKWESVCKNFKSALNKVLDERKQIEEKRLLLNKRAELIANLESITEKYNKIKQCLSEKQKCCEDANAELNRINEAIASIENEINALYSSMSKFQKLFSRFYKKNEIVVNWKNLKTQRINLVLEKCNQTNIRDKAIHEKKRAKDQYDNYEKRFNIAKNDVINIESKIKSVKSNFKSNWADDSFWENIEQNELSQESCPWVYEKYNKLREELFYQALQVNKAFVLFSDCVKQNLSRLFSLWEGKYSKDDSASSYGDLLNTLLLVIPVISTTFASVETFLSDINRDEIGLLIVDEAGQAVPQSALGALWRCQRAIIVGDPLQVEPVTTVPRELIKRFADEYNIAPYYRIPEISVQMLADRINQYGGNRCINGEDIWLGCPLLVHRRCINPMFDISNQVAYANKMFLKSAQPKPDTKFIFPDSTWYDVKGNENGNKDHTVHEQMKFTRKAFIKAIELSKGFPDLFIITPFKRVADNLRKMLSECLLESPYIDNACVNDWVKEHCGTIHTFQGKEANEVILVLGCDRQSGIGAARWVGQKPNIINVAVSRAKYRIAVIGDYDLWKDIPNVDVVCSKLNKI